MTASTTPDALNADFTQRVVQRAEDARWVASPLPGVTRRMLDRIGAEVARATSVVRYAPGSRFSRHVHGGGEEFLVLEGVFSDENGDYPAGHYLRNPPGTSHAPHSHEGCVIFVKLWQFAEDDLQPVHIDTNTDQGWQREAESGVERLLLHEHRGVQTQVLRCAAGAKLWTDLLDAGGAEFYVLDGALYEGRELHARDSWLRFPPGGVPSLHAGPQGARLWLKTGALTATFMSLAQ